MLVLSRYLYAQIYSAMSYFGCWHWNSANYSSPLPGGILLCWAERSSGGILEDGRKGERTYFFLLFLIFPVTGTPAEPFTLLLAVWVLASTFFQHSRTSFMAPHSEVTTLSRQFPLPKPRLGGAPLLRSWMTSRSPVIPPPSYPMSESHIHWALSLSF